jgi:hypothetical protein
MLIHHLIKQFQMLPSGYRYASGTRMSEGEFPHSEEEVGQLLDLAFHCLVQKGGLDGMWGVYGHP